MIRSLIAILMFLPSFARGGEIPSPAGTAGLHPFLAVSKGRLIMSWTEPAGSGHAVKIAVFDDGKWSEPSTIVERDDLFVNWADFPSVTASPDGTLFAHWLQKSSSGKYSYDVHMASSSDGRTWSRRVAVNRDGVPAEHGFVSMVPVRDDAVGVTWLDGREMKGGHDGGHEGGDMTLRYARIDRDGKFGREDLLDARVCECCTTGMAMAASGPVIVYRDRTAGERRDISVVRWKRGRWSKPVTLHGDGWKIDGCPVNGPQIDARGNNVAVAWFTAAQEKQRVLVSFSTDGGASFRKPVRVDGGAPTGRVDLVLLDDGSALVTWLDGLGDAAHIAVRRVWSDGRLGAIEKIAGSSTARGAGFPRIALYEGELFVAWTEASTPRRARLIAMPLPR